MITRQRLMEVLSYDPCTGEFFWRKRGHGRPLHGRTAIARPGRYAYITIDFERYLAHRLAWLYVHGRWPPEFLDHINGEPSDNRLVNLRECTVAENQRNQKVSARSKSGIKGVSFKYNRWQVQITHAGISHYIGSYTTAEKARQAYNEAARRLHGEFARAA